MPTTDSNGIIRYLASDGAPTPPVLNLGMQSVSDALSKSKRLGIFSVASEVEREELVASETEASRPPTASAPLFVYRTDARDGFRVEYTVNGTVWKTVNNNSRDLTGQLLEQSGSTVVAMGGVRAAVVFPTPFTASVSTVVVSSGDVVAGGLVSVGVHQFSSSNLTQFVFQAYTASGAAITTGNVRVNWIARGY